VRQTYSVRPRYISQPVLGIRYESTSTKKVLAGRVGDTRTKKRRKTKFQRDEFRGFILDSLLCSSLS
jgi:hypothetical protein